MAFGMNFFRRYQGMLLVTLVALLIMSWLVLGPIAQLMQSDDVVGTVFGENVTGRERENAAWVLGFLPKRRPDEDRVWLFIALQKTADRMGVKVSDQEVTSALREWVRVTTRATDADLQTNYESLLELNRWQDDQVRSVLRMHLRAAKVRQIYTGQPLETGARAWQRFVENRMKVPVKKLMVPASKFTDIVPKPTADEVKTRFEGNESQYILPPTSTIEYARLATENIDSLVTLTETEILDYYEKNKVEKFLLPLEEPDPEQSEPDASAEDASAEDADAEDADAEDASAEDASAEDADAEATAEDAAEEADAEATAEDAAEEADAEATAEDISTEAETAEEPVAPAAATDAPHEAASEESAEVPAESQDAGEGQDAGDVGEEPSVDIEVRYKPLSEVTEEIRRELKDKAVRDIMSDMETDYMFLKAEERNLEALAQKYALEYFKVGPLSFGETDKLSDLATVSLASGESVESYVFKNAAWAVGRAVYAVSPQGHFLVSVVSYTPERPPTLSDASDRVEADIIDERASTMARQEAAKLLDRVKEEGWLPLQKAGEYETFELTVTGGSPFAELVEAVHDVEVGGFGGPVWAQGGAHIFEVKGREEPTYEDFVKARKDRDGLEPLIARFGLETVLRFFTTGENRQTAIEIMREQERKYAFIEAWEKDFLARADIQKRTPKDQPERSSEEASPEDGS